MATKGVRQHFNLQLTLACLLIAVSTFNYGFDNQAFATTQAMEPFTRQFGVYNPKTKKYALETYWLSLFNSINYAGFATGKSIGVMIGSVISSQFGRRACMFTMSCYALITATIAVTSTSKWQILAARILNYIYVGMELSVVPVYQSEIVPTQVRGLIVGTYQLSLVLGGIVINSICRGTSDLPDNRAWRIPIGLFYIVPTIVLSLIWFIPESPRWLLSRGRTSEARIALFKLRHGTMSDSEIEAEFIAIQITLETEVGSGSFKELWQGVNLKRTFVVMGVNFFQQATGQAFSSQYGAIFIRSLGTVNPFTMSIVSSVIGAFGVLISLSTVDKIGRKPLLLAGALIQLAGLLTMGFLGTIHNASFQVKSGIVATLVIFGFGFSLGWAPLTYVVTTELPALQLRDQSQRVASLINVLTAFVVAFSLPYMLNTPYGNLKSKVGFIYGSMAFCALVFTFFFVPECKGKSLEEIYLMFMEKVPIRQFGTYKSEGLLEIGSKEVLGAERVDVVAAGSKESSV